MQFRANETIVDTSSWNKALTFCYDGDPITIEITITNKSPKNPLYVKVTDKTHETIQGLTTRILNNNELQNLASLNAGENSTTFKVKLSPTNETLFSAMYNIEYITAKLGVSCISKLVLVHNKLLMKYTIENMMPFLNKRDVDINNLNPKM